MMQSFLRSALLILAALLPAAAQSPKALPVPPPASRLDAVTFDFNADGQAHKAVVITSPTLLRIDEPLDGFSIIVDPVAQRYLGLEHRNYTWWDFSWPEVRAAVAKSKAGADQLNVGNEALDAGATLSTGTSTSSDGDDDDGGYVWHTTEEKKRVEGYNCVRWVGETVSGQPVEAWCYAGPLPKVLTAIDGLHQVNEPMAMVPMRTMAPDFIFPVYHALAKGGVTPIEIDWGGDQSRNTFRLLAVAAVESKPALFAVPKLYMKTTLESLDGMIDSQPMPGERKKEQPKTWQNP